MVIRGVPLHTLVLPHVTMLAAATATKLAEFTGAGGRVIMVGTAEVESPTGERFAVGSWPNVTVTKIEQAAAALADARPTIAAPVPTLYRRIGDAHVLFVPAVAGMSTQVRYSDWFASLETATADETRWLKHAIVNLPEGAKAVWRFDPVDASVTAIAGPSVRLNFAGAPFAVLVWSDDADDHLPPATAQFREQEQTLPTRWAARYVP